MKKIYKTIIKYVSLNIISMIGLSCYILADTYFISSSVGSDGVAALNIVLPVYSLLSAIGLLLGVGGSTLYTINKAQDKDLESNQFFTSTFYIGIIIGIFFTIVAIFFVPSIVTLLQASINLRNLCIEYLQTILFFSIFFILNQIFICFIRNDNKPNLAMFAMLIGSFSNIILDYIFINIFHMGMFGAAFATGLSPIISLFILSTHYFKKNHNFHLLKQNIDFTNLKRILSIGIPSFITEFSSGIIMLLFNFVILDISGDIGVAAYGIIANLALVFVSIFTGISQGIQPIISENYGKNNKENIRITIICALCLSLILGILFYMIGFFYSKELISIFNEENNQTLQVLANTGIKLYFLAFILMGINIVTSSIYSSLSKTKQSFLISLSRGFILIIPCLFILSYFFSMEGVWLTVFSSEVITFIMILFLYYNALKKEKNSEISEFNIINNT
ncbi:MAG: MATE family efflux transporter [Coprobacillaceae bacterium]